VTAAEESEVPAYAETAVRTARKALELGVRTGRLTPSVAPPEEGPVPEELRPRRGVFVTLESYPSGRLRGCIGFPLPVLPAHRALAEAAVAAGLEDPRFRPVRAEELDALTVEVSILSVPERLPGPPETREAEVRVGRDGLLLEAARTSGLLLPQVAVEEGWDARRFLEGVCEKSGLESNAWRTASTTISRFHAEVYREIAPRGRVARATGTFQA
jgi:uncharacterized protein (TIGR00296 family)